MPKRSKTQIKEDEKKILAVLQKNANESIDTIARLCKFSRQKVWRSIKRLEADHLIWGYTAITDDAKLDRKHYVALIKKTTKPLDNAMITAASSPLLQDRAAPEGIIIESSMYLHGDYDWMILFTAPDIRYAKRFMELLKTTYEGFIDTITLQETLFWVRKHCILNPEAKSLKDFVF
ncbi:MAG: Lrp/AsnC family transcriptional regulator [Candidatus Thermoplasmatota archaeon]|nr:Lrp/AsnC family transcriptional regulator [Candidatus Thermoplasmatota archaeon]